MDRRRKTEADPYADLAARVQQEYFHQLELEADDNADLPRASPAPGAEPPGQACPEIHPVLTVEEAGAVVEPYFLAVQETFVQAGAAKCRKVRLEIAPWIHDSPRHFAATEDTGRLMIVAPEFVELPEETVIAILAHEFGHAVDFLYPGEFVMVDDGELVRMPHVPKKLIDKKAEQANVARMKSWGSRDKDTVERTADAIAEMFTGRKIGYCGPCELQCFDRGTRPRRAGLR